jgi:glyoxylase-like metal-dependent hydrolase (beta-lactamase superfamily II)
VNDFTGIQLGFGSSFISPGHNMLAHQLIPGQPIRYVIAMHHHWDHLGASVVDSKADDDP